MGETETKRKGLMVYGDPVLFRRIRMLAAIDGDSQSEAACKAMEAYIDAHPRRAQIVEATCACTDDVTCNLHRKRRR